MAASYLDAADPTMQHRCSGCKLLILHGHIPLLHPATSISIYTPMHTRPGATVETPIEDAADAADAADAW